MYVGATAATPAPRACRLETASIVVSTDGKGTYEITDRIAAAVRRSGVTRGVVTVFVRHTSRSLIVLENRGGGGIPERSNRALWWPALFLFVRSRDSIGVFLRRDLQMPKAIDRLQFPVGRLPDTTLDNLFPPDARRGIRF